MYLCLSLALSALMARWLASALGFSTPLSLVAAVLVFHLPLARWQLGVVQLTTIWGPLAVILGSLRFAVEPRPRHAVILGVAWAACYAACNYYGLFLCLLAPVFLVLFWPGRLDDALRRRHTLKLFQYASLTLVTALLLTSPLLWGQVRYLASIAGPRPIQWVEHLSASPTDYLATWPGRWGPTAMGADSFPLRPLGAGVVATMLASSAGTAILLSSLLRRLRLLRSQPGCYRSSDLAPEQPGSGSVTGRPEPVASDVGRRWLWFCVLLAITALVASLGPRFSVGGFAPWQWLASWFPPVRLIRTPYRLAAFYQIAVVFLALEAWRFLANNGKLQAAPHVERGSNRFVLARRVAAAIVLTSTVLLAVVETWPRSSPLHDLHKLRSEPRWSSWLREHAERHAAVAMLPFPQDGSTAQYESTTLAMLRSLQFQRPLINGYSGFFPVTYRQLRVAMDDFPSAKVLQTLRGSGCRYLVIDAAVSKGDDLAERISQVEASAAYAPQLVFTDPDEPITIWRLGGP
jgi:hypothetical protein